LRIQSKALYCGAWWEEAEVKTAIGASDWIYRKHSSLRR